MYRNLYLYIYIYIHETLSIIISRNFVEAFDLSLKEIFIRRKILQYHNDTIRYDIQNFTSNHIYKLSKIISYT